MSTTKFETPSHKIHICLWFEKDGIKAAEHYISLFNNSRIIFSDDTLVSFIIDGQQITILNGGPHYKLSPAASLFIVCDGQEEIDRLWTALTADGGNELQCGWLTDKFGVSWQVVPGSLLEMINDPDEEKAKRTREAMLKSVKFDIQTLKNAYNGSD
ncbi:hypothetical protein PABG_02618 [Paracoccidioides brasiliensis Pb03]|nr:hypothetical protein PABG_02618 [Paracoccidioides brasiliensis Pb03]